MTKETKDRIDKWAMTLAFVLTGAVIGAFLL